MFEKVAQILADYKDIDIAVIKPESNFADLEIDSLDTVELLMNFEEEFGVTLEVSEDLKTLGDLSKLIDSLKK